MPLAVFRADASITIGGGHVMRCRALAGALRDLGWECRFSAVADTGDIIPDLDDFVPLSGQEEADIAALHACWPKGVDLMVVDHYGLGASFEAACRPWAKSILAIDDLADRPHDCDILLDQTPARRPEDYEALVPTPCVRLTGSDYALLRPEFFAVPDDRSDRGGRVLVSLGATDPENMTGRVLDLLARAERVTAIDVILGAAAPHRETVIAQAKSLPVPIDIHVGVSSVTPLMADCDLAIGAAGVSALERCATGLPGVMIVLAGNQRLVARNLAAAGAAVLLETAELESLTGTVSGLLGDAARLADMSRRGLALCDGRGVHRVAMAVAPDRARDGAAVRLRPVTLEDADIMLAWQSAPETRRHAHNPAIPGEAEHLAWCRRKIADPACLFNVILHDEAPAGILRLDYDATASGYVISILVAPDKYRLGLGRAALSLARRLVPDALFIAEVHADNEASMALFSGCGFSMSNGRFVQRPEADTSSPQERASG